MAFANIDGTVLHYEYLSEFEDEPVLVFANSLGSDFRIWLPLIDELTENWSILVYDKRGHGLSDVGRTPYTIADHAADLIGLTAHLGIDKAIFCGLSVGGLIVQGVYKQKPELVEKIILCDTAHRIGPAELYNDRIEAVRKAGIAPLADAILQRWFTRDFHENHQTELAGYRNMLVRQSAEGYAATCAAIRDADFTADAPKIKVPVICVVGEQDGSTTPELVKSTADLIPGAQFRIIKNAGHIPCVEQPEALAKLLADFISED
jgi:3-oxoadipate enol-lactonase